MADVLKRAEYERLFATVDAALESCRSHPGALTPMDQEVFIELRSLRMWLSSILRAASHRESVSENMMQVADSSRRG